MFLRMSTVVCYLFVSGHIKHMMPFLTTAAASSYVCTQGVFVCAHIKYVYTCAVAFRVSWSCLSFVIVYYHFLLPFVIVTLLGKNGTPAEHCLY